MIRYIFVILSAVVVVGMTVLVMLLPTSNHQSSASTVASKNSFLIEDVRIFDGLIFVKNQDIRVVDGTIIEIADDIKAMEKETVIAAQGLTALPGFIDAHTHSYGDGLKDALRFGVTTHLDMFTAEYDLLKTKSNRERHQASDRADLFSSGTMATVDGGHGTQYGIAIDTISHIDDVNAWVSARKAAGVDYIKLVYMPYQSVIPSLDLETATAVIRESHRQGFKVYAHISKQAAAKDMIEAGIDGLVHIFADSVVTDELLALAKAKRVIVIPTLAVIAAVDEQQRHNGLIDNPKIAEYFSIQQRASLEASFGKHIPGFDFAIAKQNVKRFFDAGVPILTGSDAPNAGTAYGISAHHEMSLLVEAGLTPTQALMSATYLPAMHFGLSDRGRIQVGLKADITLIDGNVEEDIVSSVDITHIFKNGYLVNRELSENNNPALETNELGYFATSAMKTIEGFSWVSTDDGMANGKSVATIKHISLPDNDGHATNLGALQVTMTVNPGFGFPWAGTAVGDFEPPITGIDISSFTTLSFRIKGTPGQYRVMAFSASSAGTPPSQEFMITEQWQTVEIKLARFTGYDLTSFSGFAFVAGTKLGQFEFVIDDVMFE